MEKAANQVKKLVAEARAKTHSVFPDPPPKPHHSKSFKPTSTSFAEFIEDKQFLGILQIHPEELARQMTIYEGKIFRQILPREWLNQVHLFLSI